MVSLSKNRGIIETNSRWLTNKIDNVDEISGLLAKNTYVGIDFGTSTTVVSIVTKDADQRIQSKTLELSQPDKYGGELSHRLVNSVLAWYKGNLLFGADAYALRQELFEGRDIFSSFKMRLGIDIGPTYPETTLKQSSGYDIVIENANDATKLFFKLLHDSIVRALKIKNYPNHVYYAISVPASFEANQRKDLIMDIKGAGIPIEEGCLIDEPNAAFLSYMNAAATSNLDSKFVTRLTDGESNNLIVFDFGAGTCDVSILEVKFDKNNLISKNLAISRFTALGGDNFDADIARKILVPQLLKSAPDFDEFNRRDLEERIIPRLQPTAEELKVIAIKWLTDRHIDSLKRLGNVTDELFVGSPVPKFKLRDTEFKLDSPTLKLHDLIQIFKPYLGKYAPLVTKSHIFAPIDDALKKANLESKEINAILFIGGSSLNPLVQTAIMDILPTSVERLVPKDLRTHVSIGTALHGFGYHAFGFDMIKPITSETISLITKGNKLEILVPVSTEVPTAKPFITTCIIGKQGQKIVELPICAGNINKLLGVIPIESENDNGFNENEEVIIYASLTHDKVLLIEAKIIDQELKTAFLNPLSNKELSPQEKLMLEAKREFNLALLKYGSRIPKSYVKKYAQKASDAGDFALAAEMFITVERIDPMEDLSTNICYNYSMAGEDLKSDEWAEIAYKRNPNGCNCWNLSLRYKDNDDIRERLLRECLSKSMYLPALYCLGIMLYNRNDYEGEILLNEYIQNVSNKLINHTISFLECQYLIHICELLQKNELLDKATLELDKIKDIEDKSLYNNYNPRNLVESKHKSRLGE